MPFFFTGVPAFFFFHCARLFLVSLCSPFSSFIVLAFFLFADLFYLIRALRFSCFISHPLLVSLPCPPFFVVAPMSSEVSRTKLKKTPYNILTIFHGCSTLVEARERIDKEIERLRYLKEEGWTFEEGGVVGGRVVLLPPKLPTPEQVREATIIFLCTADEPHPEMPVELLMAEITNDERFGFGGVPLKKFRGVVQNAVEYFFAGKKKEKESRG